MEIYSAPDLQKIDFDALARQQYERICREIPVEDDATNDYNKHPERDTHNHPSAYEKLSDAEKQALRYWIDHSVAYSRRADSSTSYGLKHHFEREGFYISNGQFKAAMVLAGHDPQDIYALNWIFKIKPRWKCKGAYSEDYYATHDYYTLGCFSLEFARLLVKAGHLS